MRTKFDIYVFILIIVRLTIHGNKEYTDGCRWL